MSSPSRMGGWPQSNGNKDRRRSTDYQIQTQLPGQGQGQMEPIASSSRRPSTSTSTSSIHASPTSISSHSHHHQQQQQQRRDIRLPRITTSHHSRRDSRDGDNHSHNGEENGDGNGNGPRSAPVSGPLRPPPSSTSNNLDGNGVTQPIRSSSSPDPWLSHSHSRQSSPSTSPIDHRSSPRPFDRDRDRDCDRDRRSPNPHPHSTHDRTITPQASSHSLTISSQHTPMPIQQDPSTSSSSHNAAGVGTLQWPQPRTAAPPRRDGTSCGQCGQTVHGQFVRAMGKVYHLNCFRCKDCNKVVAQKFFPVEDGDGMYPLCERDYFARLDLICAKCDQALRASYITACGNKYHVEHFTCSECDVLFGPNDSYYEHGGKVYCHYHYSTRFAVKCVGCESAILKQFVEMNRNGRNECWHPECYMISKFWNVRLASKTFNTPASSAVSSTVSLLEMSSTTAPGAPLTVASSTAIPTPSPGLETGLTPGELKDRQEVMEMKVQQIWHVLSGYEESSAALIGEMLRAVNERRLLDIILLAERFILHVETLFAVIDDLEAQFALAGAKAKQLCRKLVNLFSTMSQISPQGGQAPNNTELFTLITQLAHYLKILIRIALTASIKLERDHGNTMAMPICLARLNLLAMDGGDPTVAKRGVVADIPVPKPSIRAEDKDGGASAGDEEQLKRSIDALTRTPQGFISSTQGIAYGYRSLAPEITGETTLRGPQEENFIPPEGCAYCNSAIEEDCVRLGMFNRWHSACVICIVCGEKSLVSPKEDTDDNSSQSHNDIQSAIKILIRRPPARVDFFWFEPIDHVPETIFCTTHHTQSSKQGFQSVSRLEQYAFLLHIALRRLYVHFRIHHDLESVRDHASSEHEVKRVKSVTLDRKLSSTARMPQRSMVIESPAGRMADANGQVVSARTEPASLQVPDITDLEVNPDDPQVDFIRPHFARNNTSVMIINENLDNNEDPNDFSLPSIMPEDDAITLGDIPMLADAARDRRSGSEAGLDGQIYMSHLNPLQSLILKHFALLQLQKTGLGHLIELDEVLELLEVRKSQWWNKIFKGNAKKDQKKKGVFGVPIEILVERTGSDSQQGASNTQLRVPEFIEDIILTMRQMDMAVEGIFRKNGNIRRLQQVSDALDKDSTTVNLSEENPVQLAALLKRFLRELPDPLLTFRLHKLFCAAASLQNIEDRRRCLHLLAVLLPKYNRDTMEVLFVFLKWVASFSYKDEETGSRMDIANLATVICPSILYAKGANAARDESFIAIQAVQELMENQDEYFTVPPELLFVINENIYSIFAKELDLPPKEIHRHCSKYMQARGAAIPPPGIQSQRPIGGGGGGVGAGQGMTMPSSTSSGQMPPLPHTIRDRPSESRLSVHRSDGNIAGAGIGTGAGGGGGGGNMNMGVNTDITYRNPPIVGGSGTHSRPTSGIQHQTASSRGSQQSLVTNSSSPQAIPVTPWRGPFQGTGVGVASTNGSRNSSRGSAPPSPGPIQNQFEERRSIQMDRERSWTPDQLHQPQPQAHPHPLAHSQR